MPSTHKSIDVDVTPGAFLAVVTDFLRYPDFLNHVRSTRVVRQDDTCWEVEFELNLIRPVRYTLHLERQIPPGLSWSLVSGLFRSNDGSWVLEPLDDGTRTRATYTIDLQLGVFLPGSLVNTLVGKELPDMLQAFKLRAEAQ